MITVESAIARARRARNRAIFEGRSEAHEHAATAARAFSDPINRFLSALD